MVELFLDILNKEFFSHLRYFLNFLCDLMQKKNLELINNYDFLSENDFQSTDVILDYKVSC